LAWAKNLKHGARDDRLQTLQYLQDFADQLSVDIGMTGRDSRGKLRMPDDKQYGEYMKLLARCHVELGQWQTALKEHSWSVSSLLCWVLD
jgi:FKBP12-rapamycin complex-associated protein